MEEKETLDPTLSNIPKNEHIAGIECNYLDSNTHLNLERLNRDLQRNDMQIENPPNAERMKENSVTTLQENIVSITKLGDPWPNRGAQEIADKSAESSLEDFENLIKLQFKDSLSSMIVRNSNGSKFISLWNPPSNHSEKQSLSMKYLPLFYIIGSFNELLNFDLKLITFHGKIIEELKEDFNEPVSDDTKIKFCDKLRHIKICQGTNPSNMECKYDLKTVLDMYLIENLDGNTIIRSRNCKFGINEDDENNVCSECLNVKTSESIPKRKRTRAKLHRNNPIKLAEDSSCSLIEVLQNEFGDDISEDDQKEVKEEFLVADEKYLMTENIDDLSVSEEYSFADTSIKNQDSIFTSNLSMVHSDLHSNILVENLESNDSNVTVTHKRRKIQKTNKCKFCNFIGVTKLDLSDHVKTEHSDLKPYSCEICPFKAKDKRALDHHVISTHDQSKAFLCEHCSYSTPSKGRLTCHIKAVHDKFKPFICEHCSFATAAKAHLDNHIAVVHNKIKPFQCTQCPYRAANSRDMKRHVKEVHEKVRPFSCHLCPYRAGRRVLMTKHMTKMHNEHKLPTRKVKYNKVANPNSNLGYYKNKADYDLPEFKKDELPFQGNS